MPELILTFEWDGQTVHKETKGFVGSECVSKTRFIEKALGTAKDRKHKVEYYEEAQEKEDQRLRY